MADIETTVGTIVSMVASEPATYDAVGFADLSFVDIGEIETLGDFGGSATIITFTPLATGVVKKRKGSIDYGSAALAIGKIVGQAGQALLKAGFDGADRDTVHSFKVLNSDGAIAYFTGLVGNYSFTTGDANQVLRINSSIELDNEVIVA